MARPSTSITSHTAAVALLPPTQAEELSSPQLSVRTENFRNFSNGATSEPAYSCFMNTFDLIFIYDLANIGSLAFAAVFENSTFVLLTKQEHL